MIKKLPALFTLCALSVSLLAQQYTVTHLGREINTKNGESGAILIDNGTLLYSSTQGAERMGDFLTLEPTLTQIYQATRQSNGSFSKGVPCEWGINSHTKCTYNVAYDSRNDALYFTYCDPESDGLDCDIYTSSRKKGKWKHPIKLDSKINLRGYTNTHPAIGYTSDGNTILYFVSNRPGGEGGFDIWYSIIRKGKASTPANLGAPVNSASDEITPFYDNGTLYFSSNRKGGVGDYDIYLSHGERDEWAAPQNLGESINSPQNDTYFSVTATNEGFFSSNRKDSFFASDTFCCNDIYHWTLSPDSPIAKKEQPQKTVQKQEQKQTPDPYTEPQLMQQSIRTLFPIKLYFHNDQPDPRSHATTTTTTYFQTYNRYMFLRDTYKAAWNTLADSLQRDSVFRALDHFFDYEAKSNCDRFESFIAMLAEDLKAGHTVSLTVTGYASPLHSSEYNASLSKRRISSIVNQIREWRNGRLRRFIDAGRLIIKEVSFGDTQSHSDVSANPADEQHSVYSVEAAKERRIEILDYNYEDD